MSETKRILGFFFWVWYISLYSIITFFVVLSSGFFSVVMSKIIDEDKALSIVWAIGRFWGRSLYWITFSPVKVVGAENIPQDKASMVISNHTSSFDIMVGIGYYPIQVLFFSKKEIFDIPLFGEVMRFMKFISVDRNDPKKAASALLEGVRKIKKGYHLLLYPEGTRKKDFGQILDFKPGLNIIARQAGVPIVPIVIEGNDILKPPYKKFFVYPTNITIRILPAITSEHPFHPVHEGKGKEEDEILHFFTELFRENTRDFYKEFEVKPFE